MYKDRVVIFAKAGNGGNGLISLAHHKYVEYAGPDGGDGGAGGSVYLRVNPHLNSLHKLHYQPHWSAEDGKIGGSKDCHGANGPDLYIEVPVGTVVYDNIADEPIVDLAAPGDDFLLLDGGRGGYGNAHFKRSTLQTPRFAEIGDVGREGEFRLELKTVADVGIIGFPNAGKSTFISVISNAKPKIADYEFTTITPNLGVVFDEKESRSMVVCDIPGLIEGASEGKGLGHHFLRHVERCSVLVHLIDVQAMDLAQQYRTIRTELEKHSEVLAAKPEIVVLSKADLADEETVNALRDEFMQETGLKEVYVISSATHSGTRELIYRMLDEVAAYREAQLTSETTAVLDDDCSEDACGHSKASLDTFMDTDDADVQEDAEEVSDEDSEKTSLGTSGYKIFRPHLDNDDTYNVSYDKKEKLWVVKGIRIEQIGRMTMWGNKEGEARLYYILEKKGVLKEIKRNGGKFGDRIFVGAGSLKYLDLDE